MNQTLWSTKYENVSQVTHLTCVRVQVWQPTSAETCMWGEGLAAMLALYTGKGIAPEVNLREPVSHTPLQSLNKAAHSGFETQRRHHQKSKTGVSVAPQMKMYPTNFFFKKVWICTFTVENTCSSVLLTLVTMSSSFSASLYQQILDICTVIVNQIIQIFCK